MKTRKPKPPSRSAPVGPDALLLASLESRLDNLEAEHDALEQVMRGIDGFIATNLMRQMSELGLQVLFMLRYHRIKRPLDASLILGPNDKPQIEVVPLLQVFEEQREVFIGLLKKEAAEREQNLPPYGNGTAPAGEAGAGVTAAPAQDPALARADRAATKH
jgi:hypothetical protein